MHELGIVFHIIDSLKEVGQQNDLKKIQSVTLELGEVSAVVHEELLDCWKWASAKHDLVKEAKMYIEPIKAYTECYDCGEQYETVEHGRICPYCGSEKTFLKVGNEINIKTIEAI